MVFVAGFWCGWLFGWVAGVSSVHSEQNVREFSASWCGQQIAASFLLGQAIQLHPLGRSRLKSNVRGYYDSGKTDPCFCLDFLVVEVV